MSTAFPDIVAALVAHVGTEQADPVYSRVPNPRPARFIQLRRVGGPASLVRDEGRVDVFCWAPTEPAATELGATVRTIFWALPGKPGLPVTVYLVDEFKGPSIVDDPETGTPRSWATYSVLFRAPGAIPPTIQ